MAPVGLAGLTVVTFEDASCLIRSGLLGVLGIYMELLLGRGATECCASGKRLVSM